MSHLKQEELTFVEVIRIKEERYSKRGYEYDILCLQGDLETYSKEYLAKIWPDHGIVSVRERKIKTDYHNPYELLSASFEYQEMKIREKAQEKMQEVQEAKARILQLSYQHQQEQTEEEEDEADQ